MSKSSVFDILNELEATPGSLAKREILENNSTNKLLKATFVASNDPFIVYYVSKFKLPKPKHVHDDDVVLKSFLNDLLHDLSLRKITGNAAKDALNTFLSSCDENQQKWCKRIILKNLRCGIQESTINKVWEGIIKTFDVALANTLPSHFEEGKGIVLDEEVKYPVRGEPKLDGLRCVTIKRSGEVKMFTRNGSELETLPTIKKSIENIKRDNFVLDGEGMATTWNDSNSIMMSHKTHKDDSNMVYHVFDMLSLEEWDTRNCQTPYDKRCENLSKLMKEFKEFNDANIKQVDGTVISNEKELYEFYDVSMNEGYEGIMIKTMNSFYKFKRSDNILKLKPVVTYEGMIVNHLDGNEGTKREGVFGKFEIVLPNGVVTKVGSGFSDKLKAEIQIEGPSKYIGKIVEVEGQPDPLTKDGLTKDGKVRFPVFIRFRDARDVDKKVIKAGEKYLKEN